MAYVRPPDPGGTHKNANLNLKKNIDLNNMSNVNLELTHENKETANNRKRPFSPGDSVSIQPKYKFLILRRPNGETMAKVSPFLIDKVLTLTAGYKSIKTAKKLRDGSMLVETFTYDQAQKLLTRLPKNEILPVTVEPHRTLNKVKGVITCYDLDSVDIQEIKDQLCYQGVEDVIRINRRIDNTTQPTHSYIIIFGLTTLPEKIKIGYLSVPVRPYIPLPFRCHNCHKFNHSKATCRSNAICPGCGGPVHEDECTTKQCVNCNGNHVSTDRNCPVWLIEKKIAEVKTVEKISYVEAKNKIKAEQPALFDRSFSDLFKKTDNQVNEEKRVVTKDQGIQCDIMDSFMKCKEEHNTKHNSTPTDSNRGRTEINKITPKNPRNKQEITINKQTEMEMMWKNQWDCDTDEDSTTSSQSDVSAKTELKPASSPQSKKKSKHKPKKKGNRHR